ncbi:hypothetical protein GCM10025778_21540 [Paeniglutamicibacter antarcticus]|uniref:Uncharacterized protein n=2 Tax=Paeniglutamicibacter antarcticus TaxID=494023 RepID=A0ABP9TMK8_9MICC
MVVDMAGSPSSCPKVRIKAAQLLGVRFEIPGKSGTPVLQQGKQFLAAEDSAHDARGRLQPVAQLLEVQLRARVRRTGRPRSCGTR